MIIIAEFGSNPASYDWDLLPFIEAASESGATHAKVQMFKASHFPEDEQEAKKPLEFPRNKFGYWVDVAHDHGLAFGASVFDHRAVNIVAEHGDFIKIATRESNEFTLLTHALSSDLPVFRSIDFRKPQQYGRLFNEILLGCIPEYPTEGCEPAVAQNIEKYLISRPFGWSSHTTHWVDVVGAVIRGATVIEKHFCLDPTDIEARWSLEPDGFLDMVAAIEGALDRRERGFMP